MLESWKFIHKLFLLHCAPHLAVRTGYYLTIIIARCFCYLKRHFFNTVLQTSCSVQEIINFMYLDLRDSYNLKGLNINWKVRKQMFLLHCALHLAVRTGYYHHCEMFLLFQAIFLACKARAIRQRCICGIMYNVK